MDNALQVLRERLTSREFLQELSGHRKEDVPELVAKIYRLLQQVSRKHRHISPPPHAPSTSPPHHASFAFISRKSGQPAYARFAAIDASGMERSSRYHSLTR